MKFLNPVTLKIEESELIEYLQFGISAEEILTTGVAKIKYLFKERVPLPQVKNKPVYYKVELFENDQYIMEEKYLSYIIALILSSLCGKEQTSEKFITAVPAELDSAYITPMSLLTYLNYGIGHPIQVEVTRKYIVDGELKDMEVYYLV